MLGWILIGRIFLGEEFFGGGGEFSRENFTVLTESLYEILFNCLTSTLATDVPDELSGGYFLRVLISGKTSTKGGTSGVIEKKIREQSNESMLGLFFSG